MYVVGACDSYIASTLSSRKWDGLISKESMKNECDKSTNNRIHILLARLLVFPTAWMMHDFAMYLTLLQLSLTFLRLIPRHPSWLITHHPSWLSPLLFSDLAFNSDNETSEAPSPSLLYQRCNPGSTLDTNMQNSTIGDVYTNRMDLYDLYLKEDGSRIFKWIPPETN